MGLVLDLWVVCSSEKPIDRHVKLIGNLRQPVNVQGSDSGIFDVDGSARAHADAARNPIWRRVSQLAGFTESFAEDAKITRIHNHQIGITPKSCKSRPQTKKPQAIQSGL
jgi:hypothetical protein